MNDIFFTDLYINIDILRFLMPRYVPTGTPAGRDGVDATGLDAAFRGNSSTQIPILWPHNCH